jgi:hypothetical protein
MENIEGNKRAPDYERKLREAILNALISKEEGKDERHP